MTPISGSLQIITVVLAVLAALATWLLWNRMRGPRAVRVLQRATLLVFGELMAAMAILVWVNISSGGLVVSWQDLLGNQSTRGGVFAGQLGSVLQESAGAGRKLYGFAEHFMTSTFLGTSTGLRLRHDQIGRAHV